MVHIDAVVGAVGEFFLPFVPVGVFLWRLVSPQWRSHWDSVAVCLSELHLDLPSHVNENHLQYLARSVPTSLRQLRVWARSAVLRTLALCLPPCLLALEVELENGEQDVEGDFDLLHLAAALPKLPNLVRLKLRLGSFCVSDSGLFALAACLPQHIEHLTLDLEDCDITDAGMQALAQRLPRYLSALHLYLGANGSTTESNIGFVGASSLGEAIPDSAREIDLEFNHCPQIQDDAVRIIVEKLPNMLSVLKLSLYCDISDTTPQLIGQTLGRLQNLTMLELNFMKSRSGPNITVEGGISVMRALPSSVTSLTLGLLSFDAFADTGVAVLGTLADALREGIRSLDLHLPWIPDTAFLRLAKALPGSLENLSLFLSSRGRRGKGVGKGERVPCALCGAAALSQAIQRNSGLRTLSLSLNLGDEGVRKLVYSLPAGLTRLTLRDTSVRDDGVRNLVHSLPAGLVQCILLFSRSLPAALKRELEGKPRIGPALFIM